MALTDKAIKAANIPKGKTQKPFYDMNGLYLLVNQSGKYWRWDYEHNHKRKTASFGVYPKVSLKEARQENTNAHQLVKQGIDYNQYKKEKKQQAKEQQSAQVNTFEAVAIQWHESRSATWTDKHATTINSRLKNYVFPLIGAIPVAKLTRQQVIDVIKGIVNKGLIDTAKRITQVCRQILEYACDSGYIDAVPMGNMTRFFPDVVTKKMPAILEPKRIGVLMRSIHDYQGTYIVKMALCVLPYLVVRSTEFRLAKWEDIDLDKAIWTIPAKDRKQRKSAKEKKENVHIEPLPSQAIAIFSELKAFTGHGVYVFPSRTGKGIMSENTINKALHNMGFKGEMVGHGFRAMFKTCMIEQGFNKDVLERQLAHVIKDKTEKAYDRAKHMQERTRIMQHWASYLDALRDGATVLAIGRKG